MIKLRQNEKINHIHINIVVGCRGIYKLRNQQEKPGRAKRAHASE